MMAKRTKRKKARPVKKGEETVRGQDGRFGAGNPGRPRGARNRVPARITEMIVASVEARGGQRYLDGLPDGLFVALLKTILPRRQDLNISSEKTIDEYLREMAETHLEPDEVA